MVGRLRSKRQAEDPAPTVGPTYRPMEDPPTTTRIYKTIKDNKAVIREDVMDVDFIQVRGNIEIIPPLCGQCVNLSHNADKIKKPERGETCIGVSPAYVYMPLKHRNALLEQLELHFRQSYYTNTNTAVLYHMGHYHKIGSTDIVRFLSRIDAAMSVRVVVYGQKALVEKRRLPMLEAAKEADPTCRIDIDIAMHYRLATLSEYDRVPVDDILHVRCKPLLDIVNMQLSPKCYCIFPTLSHAMFVDMARKAPIENVTFSPHHHQRSHPLWDARKVKGYGEDVHAHKDNHTKFELHKHATNLRDTFTKLPTETIRRYRDMAQDPNHVGRFRLEARVIATDYVTARSSHRVLRAAERHIDYVVDALEFVAVNITKDILVHAEATVEYFKNSQHRGRIRNERENNPEAVRSLAHIFASFGFGTQEYSMHRLQGDYTQINADILNRIDPHTFSDNLMGIREYDEGPLLTPMQADFRRAMDARRQRNTVHLTCDADVERRPPVALPGPSDPWDISNLGVAEAMVAEVVVSWDESQGHFYALQREPLDHVSVEPEIAYDSRYHAVPEAKFHAYRENPHPLSATTEEELYCRIYLQYGTLWRQYVVCTTDDDRTNSPRALASATKRRRLFRPPVATTLIDDSPPQFPTMRYPGNANRRSMQPPRPPSPPSSPDPHPHHQPPPSSAARPPRLTTSSPAPRPRRLAAPPAASPRSTTSSSAAVLPVRVATAVAIAVDVDAQQRRSDLEAAIRREVRVTKVRGRKKKPQSYAAWNKQNHSRFAKKGSSEDDVVTGLVEVYLLDPSKNFRDDLWLYADP